MKALSLLCAVSIIASCVRAAHGLAVPPPPSAVQVDDPMEAEALREPERSWTGPEVLSRTKRQSHLSLCRYCCKCCKNKGCGYCCRF